jgi:hypothetical protein
MFMTFGTKNRAECYLGTPYHAKALELEAKQSDLQARESELAPLQFNIGGVKDPDEKKREQCRKELNKLRAEWLRLQADMLRWKAKECRKEDPTQKSNPFQDVEDLVKGRLIVRDDDEDFHCFFDTPYQAKAYELRSKMYDLRARMNKLTPMSWDHGVSLDPDKDKRDRIERDVDAVQAEILSLKSQCMKWKAKKIREMDKTQKGAFGILNVRNDVSADDLSRFRYLWQLQNANKGGFSTIVKGTIKNPKGTGVDVDTGMMPQRDVDVPAREVPAPEVVNPDQPVTRKAKADIFPEKEDLSKPVPKGKEVEHYVHKFKHGEPLSTTGKPPESREQAIAIGMSEARKGKTVSKSFPLPVR